MYRKEHPVDEGFLNRLASLPVSQDALSQFNQLYTAVQGRPVLAFGLRASETGMCIAAKIATPLVNRLPVDKLDAYACKQLDRFESYVPVVKEKNSRELFQQTKDMGYKAATLPLVTAKAIKDRSVEKIYTAKDYTVGKLHETYGVVQGGLNRSCTEVRGRVTKNYHAVQEGVYGTYESVQTRCAEAKKRSQELAKALVQPVVDVKQATYKKVANAHHALDSYHADVLSYVDVAITSGFLRLLRTTDVLLQLSEQECNTSFEKSMKAAVPDAEFQSEGLIRRHYLLLKRLYDRNAQFLHDVKDEKEHLKDGAINGVYLAKDKTTSYLTTSRPVTYAYDTTVWAKDNAVDTVTTTTNQATQYYKWVTTETLPGRVVVGGVVMVWNGLGYTFEVVQIIYDQVNKQMTKSNMEVDQSSSGNPSPAVISTGFQPLKKEESSDSEESD